MVDGYKKILSTGYRREHMNSVLGTECTKPVWDKSKSNSNMERGFWHIIPHQSWSYLMFFFCSGKEIDSLFLCFIKYIFHTIHSDHSFPYLLSFQILPTPAHPPNYTPSFVLPLENKQANNKPTRIKQNKKEKQKKSKK